MKHVKLFESFVQKYEQIKELPIEGSFNGVDDNKLMCVIQALHNENYESVKKHDNTTSKQISVAWWIYLKYKPNAPGKYSSYDTLITSSDKEIYATLLDFNDYFIPKHEFRGLNLKNKFGL